MRSVGGISRFQRKVHIITELTVVKQTFLIQLGIVTKLKINRSDKCSVDETLAKTVN